MGVPLSKLRVSGRKLTTVDGKPFFLLADTAWELFHRLGRDDAAHYLDVRAEQNFRMVWAVGLAEFDGVRSPNAYGDKPLVGDDPTKLAPAYWNYVDWVVGEAESRGLYVGILPTWGDKVTPMWGTGPLLFPADKPEIAHKFAWLVAEKLRHRTNLLWVLGGDRPARSDDGKQDFRPVWSAMAEGIRQGWGQDAVLCYHPSGGNSSSKWLNDAAWLDMHCFQSGHGAGRDVAVWDFVERDLRSSKRPTFDAEVCYEDHPVSPWPTWDPKNGHFDEYDVRRAVYRSVFSGACGVVYGHHSVWQMASEDPATWINHVKMPWKQAVTRPGAEHMRHLRTLVEQGDFFELQPADDLVDQPLGSGGGRIVASRSPLRVLVYVPADGAVKLKIEVHNAHWFDPRTGVRRPAEKKDGAYKAPSDIDWVLEAIL